LVLVEGQDADGATMDRDTFAVSHGGIGTYEQATAAVLRTEAIAATRGLRLHSIGVTWSEDADVEASMLMKSLSESGFDNVVAIRMPEATEALARGVAEVLGYATTAVCVIEPESVVALIVNTSDGAVQTAFNHGIDSNTALIGWLSTVFARADWEPEALVVVGSAGDFGRILGQLQDALSVPVFAPEEAKLALARGAALASTQGSEAPLDPYVPRFSGLAQFGASGRHRTSSEPHRRRTLARVGPAAMLATGVVTFVVSVSIAVSLQLAPGRETQIGSPVPAARVQTPAAVKAAPVATPPPVVLPPAPVVEAALPPDSPDAPPPVYDEPPVAIVDTPAESPVDQPPAAAPDDPPAAAPGDATSGGAVPADPELAPPDADQTPLMGASLPPGYVPPVPAIPTKKPGILARIKEKLTPGPG
jgi:hypothetical protein